MAPTHPTVPNGDNPVLRRMHEIHNEILKHQQDPNYEFDAAEGALVMMHTAPTFEPFFKLYKKECVSSEIFLGTPSLAKLSAYEVNLESLITAMHSDERWEVNIQKKAGRAFLSSELEKLKTIMQKYIVAYMDALPAHNFTDPRPGTTTNKASGTDRGLTGLADIGIPEAERNYVLELMGTKVYTYNELKYKKFEELLRCDEQKKESFFKSQPSIRVVPEGKTSRIARLIMNYPDEAALIAGFGGAAIGLTAFYGFGLGGLQTVGVMFLYALACQGLQSWARKNTGYMESEEDD